MDRELGGLQLIWGGKLLDMTEATEHIASLEIPSPLFIFKIGMQTSHILILKKRTLKHRNLGGPPHQVEQ